MYKKVRHQERPFVLHIFIGMAPDQIAKKLNKEKNGRISFEPDYFTLPDDTVGEAVDLEEFKHGHFAIIFRSTDVSPEDIAHEAVHVTARHFRYIGQPLDINSEESYAYMIGWITGIIYNMIYELPARGT